MVSMRRKFTGSMVLGQTALDFMISYGIAFIIIAVALAVILSTDVFSAGLAPDVCTPQPGFTCDSFAVSPSGVFVIKLSQTTDSTINVTAAACSTLPNPNNVSRPFYGNVDLLPYDKAPQYYPDSSLQYGAIIYSGGYAVISTYCYSGPDSIASGHYGNQFIGYFWINYTTSGLLPTNHNIVRVASFTTKYT
ncbi:MAG: hypothetical protein UNLARM2_0240 [Candidatus Micrarchaeum acidiphilum ARMAN-2]|jgi:hypothetical protein|uniref:Uncharacterized protein n=1 Tax=Candidatus Micrarchaeum acidiphilum ARMAN-2 TaxID=425595 RepID=C7DGN9_MICA2|nr:MAG: hypothetical protein UNLARM2_0240 [Candidatus Micrarchaeum acidiphilum ARMAN-2]